jgi:hypothetical protein
MTTEKVEEIEVAKGSGYRVWIPMKKIDPSLDLLLRILTRQLKSKIRISRRILTKKSADHLGN